VHTNIVEDCANDQREDYLLSNFSLALERVSSHSESLSTHQVFELKEASSLCALKTFQVWNVQLKEVALRTDRVFDSAIVELVEECQLFKVLLGFGVVHRKDSHVSIGGVRESW
jgi:hypothetical protein